MTENQARQAAILDKIWELVRDHGRESGEVIRSLKFNWVQVGYELRSNGYSVEYKNKPKSKK